MNVKSILLSSIIAIAMVSCGNSTQKSNTNTSSLEGNIKIDGSSTVYPISEAVAEEFRKIHPDVRVTIGVSGTGGGFKKFARKETDISNASRLIKDLEIETCKENGVSFHNIMIAYDGLAVVIHPKNDWASSITIEELKKIWEPDAQDVIKKWNQIRPEWPDETIRLFGPGIASGTYDYFTEAVVGKSGSSRGDFTASEDDNVLVQGVATDIYSLGFFGLAYFEENHDKLKLVAVDGGNGPVIPTFETVSKNEYSPLSRPIFIYVNDEAAKREEVIEFVKFYIQNAGELSLDVGYISLPEELYVKELESFNAFVSQNK